LPPLRRPTQGKVIGGASHLSTSPQESNEDSDVGW